MCIESPSKALHVFCRVSLGAAKSRRAADFQRVLTSCGAMGETPQLGEIRECDSKVATQDGFFLLFHCFSNECSEDVKQHDSAGDFQQPDVILEDGGSPWKKTDVIHSFENLLSFGA